MMILKNSTKGILTMISSIIIIGNNYTFANINIYVATYLKYTNYPDISKTDCYFLLPICVLFITGTSGLGGLMERKLGPRITISIGILIIGFAYFMMYLTVNLLLLYLFVALIGVGVGVAYMPPLRTLWKYYPKKKGLCTGISLAAFGTSAMIFNKVSDVIINPNHEGLDPETQFYPKDVGLKVPDFYFYTFIIVIVAGLLGVLILFPHEEEGTYVKSNLIEKNYEDKDFIDLDSSTHEITKKSDMGSIKLAFKSRRFFLLYCMAFLYVFYPYMLTNLIKPYGLLSVNEDDVNLILIIFPIANGVTRVLWGWCCDIFGFKKVYISLLIVGLISSSTISFISTNAALYTFYCIMTVATLAGNYAALPYVTSKVFGLKNSAEIYGLIFLNCGISCFIGPFVIKFIIGNSNDKSLFHTVFWIGSVMQVICIILCSIFSEREFDYEEKTKTQNS